MLRSWMRSRVISAASAATRKSILSAMVAWVDRARGPGGPEAMGTLTRILRCR